MSVLLWLLGVVTTAAGLALVASGLTIHDGTVDPEVVTPGTIAAVGGLLLIGMGLAVRELRRIERALAAQPMPRATRPGEVPAAGAPESPDIPVRIPFPPKPKINSDILQPLPSPAANTPAAPTEGATSERLRAKSSALATENGPVAEETDASLAPRAPLRVEENVSEVKDTTGIRRGANGAAAGRAVPRLEAKVRLSAAPDRTKSQVLNAFWPVGPRRDNQTASAQVSTPVPPPPIAPVPASEMAPDASPTAGEPAAAPPVSILKSGVIEGMAYTLYSDGSIEAQLPQGTLRFGSIAALRDHIEKSS